MNNTVFLRVNGRDWGGWTSVRISAGIDRIARDFNVSITRQWPGGEDVPPVKNGDAVEVLIGDDLVITGWVEALPLRYDAQTIMTGIVGRSKTADLIDCSASPAQHNGKNLFLIASALARPLVLGRPGSMKAATALVLGENILSCDTERSVRERFSSYLVTGQRPGTDDDFGEATIAAIRQSTGDAGVTRYRPHTIQQSGTATTDSCKSRCEFEARQRAAKTLETTYTVQGWRQGNGELWKPNQAVVVYDPLNGFDNETLVIAEVTYSQDNNGTLTEIRVGPADAYLPEPFRPKAKKKVSEEADF